MSAKLACLNPDHPTINALNQYVLNLARYDTNYDLRDRARFLRVLSTPQPEENDTPGVQALKAHVKDILFADKQAPSMENGEGKLGREQESMHDEGVLIEEI